MSNYSVVFPQTTDTASLTGRGDAMVDLLSATDWGCYAGGGSAPTCSSHGTSQAIIRMLLSGGATPTIDLLGSAVNGVSKGTDRLRAITTAP